MTVKETLEFMAGLRGVVDVKKFVQSQLKLFQLELYSSSQVTNLSGGVKRKLCTAQAFTGSPKVILLDEASTGVDPVSRKWLW
jgi:ATP-binding cassette subfamily A (ABC1) protein 3